MFCQIVFSVGGEQLMIALNDLPLATFRVLFTRHHG
jgi:hypothetical protein